MRCKPNPFPDTHTSRLVAKGNRRQRLTVHGRHLCIFFSLSLPILFPVWDAEWSLSCRINRRALVTRDVRKKKHEDNQITCETMATTTKGLRLRKLGGGLGSRQARGGSAWSRVQDQASRPSVGGRLHPFASVFAAGRVERGRAVAASAASSSSLDALIFDCDGVILESEHLHREAYNKAFEEFGLEIGGDKVVWTEEFYDILQNTVGGGKPKMRWYFGKYGWPSQKGGVAAPGETDAQESLVDALQDFKTQAYKDLVANVAKPRPGVLRLMEEARSAGIYVAVCSAATKTSVEFTLNNLLGEEQFSALDCFLAGDDVSNKKPDPEIYITASKKLDVHPDKCIVVEDSTIGLNAALGAGMDCIITYTGSTATEAFEGAKMVVSDLGESPAKVTLDDLIACKAAEKMKDDRVVSTE